MPTDVEESRSWLREAAPTVVGAWVGARALVALGIGLAHALSGRVALPVGRIHLDQGLVTWDGDAYRSIAERGYGRIASDLVRFFPLYPETARFVAPVLGGRTDVALVLITNLTALAAMFVLWKFVVESGHDASVAARAVVLATAFPAAMSLVYAYAEGPFLLCLLAAALAMQLRRPLVAAFPLLCLGLLRPTGVLVCVAVVVLAVGDLRVDRAAKRVVGWVVALVAPVAGAGAYLWWLEATEGRGAAPLDVQRELRAGFRDPVTRLAGAVWDVARFEFRDTYNLAFAVALIVAVVLAVRRRLPLAWTAYLVVGLLVALSANNIDSTRPLRPPARAGAPARVRRERAPDAAVRRSGRVELHRTGVVHHRDRARPRRPLIRYRLRMARRRKKNRSADEVSIVIDAPADRLYDIVSDVSNMGRLSPECTGGKWLGGAKGPAVDAVFRGRNRRGPVIWATSNRVVAANRGREFAFETKQSGTRWRYRFVPDGDRTIVTESREPWRSRPMVARVFSVFLLGGIADHDEEMRAGMRQSLERLKDVAEQPDAASRRARRKAARRAG